MSYTPYINVMSFETAPMAIPVVEKHEFIYSITTLIAAVGTAIGASVFWWGLLISSGSDIISDIEIAKNVIVAIVAIVVLLAIMYSQLYHRLTNKIAVPIYSAETLSDPAMSNNIVSGFEANPNQTIDFTNRTKRNFQHPSLTPDLIEVLNKILMSFYGVCEKVFNKLEKIDDRLSSVERTVEANTNSILLLDTKVDKLDAKVDKLDAKVDKLDAKVDTMQGQMGTMQGQMNTMQGQMDTMQGQMSDVLINLKQINMTLTNFAFVVPS